MNNQDQPELDALFHRWLDKEVLSNHELRLLRDNKHYAASMDTCDWIENESKEYINTPVPNWDRSSTFVHGKVTRQPFWQTLSHPSLSMASMAMSVCAILLVLFKVNISVTDDGLLVNFGGQEHQMAKMLDAKMKEFSQTNQASLASYLESREALQQKETMQLVTYLVDSNRQERKEDISSLVSYINDQRSDDRALYYQQLQDIQFSILEPNAAAQNGFKRTQFNK